MRILLVVSYDGTVSATYEGKVVSDDAFNPTNININDVVNIDFSIDNIKQILYNNNCQEGNEQPTLNDKQKGEQNNV